MGLRISWDIADISRQIRALTMECASPYNTGFVTFEYKKDLYQLKELIDRALQETPNFGELEKEWLLEQEQKRVIRILKT